MQTLQPFIPYDRRRAMEQGEALPDRSHGAVLFADISGFTPLTEALVKLLGPIRGAEELTEQLNRVYSRLVDEVHRYRGSVISFSGDAITCWFDAAADDTPPAARTLACALHMQTIMQELNSAAEQLTAVAQLAIKIGIVSGQVRRFQVGDPHIQLIDTLAGSLLDEVAAAEGLARRGEILVQAGIVDQLAHSLTVAEWRQAENGQQFAIVTAFDQPVTAAPWPPIAASAIAVDRLRPWVLPTIYEHLQSGTTHFLAELRSAVSLFLKFSGLEYDQDEEAGEKLDSFVRWAQGIITKYEGTLLQLTIGDKGSYFHAAFGAPMAHENDPDRAVMAALELRTPPAELDYIKSIQIGISLGRMRGGTYGGQRRQVYGVLGDEVNVAARLMIHAQSGQIIVSERVVNGVNRPFRFHLLGDVAVKGKEKSLPVYELLSGKGFAGEASLSIGSQVWLNQTRMVGRQVEKAALAARLAALKAGESAVLIIEGEPGIGKSRLVAELFQQAQAEALPVLLGEADAIDRSTPFYAWRPIFRQLFGLDELPEQSDLWREQIQQQLPDQTEFQERLALLNVLLPLDFAETERSQQMTGQVRGDNTNRLLLSILENYFTVRAEQPHLLIFEDVQWLDSASWTLLMLVQRSLPGLLLVLATRPFSDLIPSEYSQLRQLPTSHVISLDMLEPAEILQLVCQRLGVDALPSPVTRLIANKAEGHPFFSEELAYALRDTGLIEIKDGRCTLSSQAHNLEHLDFPDTIEGIITSRIDRLSPSQQLVLKVASVIGRIFTMHILGAVYPVDTLRDKLVQDLIKLEQLDITPLESPEPELAYYFKHIITKDVSYNLMTFAQRGQLHTTVATWYETHYAEDLSPFYPLLAHHWQKARETAPTDQTLIAKALFYHGQAGTQALRNGIYREAAYFLEQALALQENLPDIAPLHLARWQRQLGEAQLGMGLVNDGRRTLANALTTLGYRVPASKVRLAGQTIAALGRQIIHRWRSRPPLSAAGEREQLLEVAHTLELYGEASYLSGDIVALVHAMFRALNVAEKTEPSRESALANAYLVGIVGLFKRPQWVTGYRQRALEMAQLSNHLPTIGRVLHIISVAGVGNGTWTQIEKDEGRAIDIYQHLGDRRQLGESLTVLILTRNYQGEFEESIALCNRLLHLAQQSDNLLQQMWAYNLHAMNLLQLGQPEAAQLVLDQVTALPLENKEINYDACQALTHFRLGRLAETRRCADTAMAKTAQTSVVQISMLNAYSALAEVYLALWQQTADSSEKAALHDLAAQACKRLTVFGSRFNSGLARAALWQGVYAWYRQRPRQAVKQWQKSLVYAQKYSLSYDIGLAHYYLGQHLETAAAAEHRTQAQAIFREIKAVHRLAQMDATE